MLGKAELVDAIAPQNRGILASETDKKAILAAVARLEDRNPNPRPLASPELLEGNWRLLYTTSQELLGIERFPLARLGQIYQCVRVAEKKIYNIAEVLAPSPLTNLASGLVSVAASFVPVSERRVNVAFERGVIGLQSWLGYQGPSAFIQKLQTTPKFPIYQGVDFTINRENQSGWLEVTYIDDDLRIGRGNAGSVFVLRKSS